VVKNFHKTGRISLNEKNEKIPTLEKEIEYIEPNFGITVNSKGFGNIHNESKEFSKTSKINQNMESSDMSIKKN